MTSLESTDAVILCGGLGQRLRSVAPDQPKPMVDIAGKPFLEHQTLWLKHAGYRRIILCSGYRSSVIRDFFGTAWNGLQFVHSDEPEPLGTGGALRYALPHIKSQTFLAMNGDSWLDLDLTDFQASLSRHKVSSAIALSWLDDVSDYGSIRLDERQFIVDFAEKSVRGGGWVNGGVYLLPRTALEQIPSNRPSSLEKDFFPALLQQGVLGFRCKGDLYDIGTPERLARARTFFAKRQNRTLAIPLTQQPFHRNR